MNNDLNAFTTALLRFLTSRKTTIFGIGGAVLLYLTTGTAAPEIVKVFHTSADTAESVVSFAKMIVAIAAGSGYSPFSRPDPKPPAP